MKISNKSSDGQMRANRESTNEITHTNLSRLEFDPSLFWSFRSNEINGQIESILRKCSYLSDLMRACTIVRLGPKPPVMTNCCKAGAWQSWKLYWPMTINSVCTFHADFQKLLKVSNLSHMTENDAFKAYLWISFKKGIPLFGGSTTDRVQVC